MKNLKSVSLALFMALMLAGSTFLVGCGGGVSEEQMQQLNDLKAEVESLQSQVNAKQNEKSQLE
ncbi:MAG: hypothetical protein OZ913_10130, partial [Ignavibacteriaceae bacterium]|nr:hypothetical protein [Ignavibacteriaceae bacterium]